MNKNQVKELLLQALETEIGGVKLYQEALDCVFQPELREEYEKYLEETREHEAKLREVFEAMGIDPEAQSPGRAIVRHLGESLLHAMKLALKSGDRNAAQIVATECIALAESKDHQNWELIGEIIGDADAENMDELADAHADIEDQEDEHLYHSRGWSRELWLDALELPAILPPPEERKDVKTAIEAARAKESSKPRSPKNAKTKAKPKSAQRNPTRARGRTTGAKSRERSARR